MARDCQSIRTRTVICPATPSSKPYLPKILKAAASLSFRYLRSAWGSSKVGGLGIESPPSLLAFAALNPGSCVVKVGLFSAPLWMADGGDMMP